MHLADAFIQSDLHLYCQYMFWESNPQPFAQCSTTEPQDTVTCNYCANLNIFNPCQDVQPNVLSMSEFNRNVSYFFLPLFKKQLQKTSKGRLRYQKTSLIQCEIMHFKKNSL